MTVYRHSLAVRLTHWIWALCLALLLMSGLQIFNAHAALYWGQASDFDRPWLAMKAVEGADGNAVGLTTVFGHQFNTTGLLGVSTGPDGELLGRGFPAWITVPSDQDLAAGRRWHFFFAWLLVFDGFAYYVFAFAAGHWRDLIPSRHQVAHIGHSIWDHLRLRFSHDAHYNVLQKLSYMAVLFVLLPLMVLTGLAMSPGVDSAVPALVTLFDGRQSARTIHFVTATALVLFFMIHVAMVLVSGAWNNMRSMITGRYATKPTGGPDDKA